MITKSTSGTISSERMMSVSNQIFLVVDAGTPVAAFTARRELHAYLRRRLDTFINSLAAKTKCANVSCLSNTKATSDARDSKSTAAL